MGFSEAKWFSWMLFTVSQSFDRRAKEYDRESDGGRIFLFLLTDNFKRDFQNLLDNEITIVRKPVFEQYGTVAVFKDIYGNLWDLIEPSLK